MEAFGGNLRQHTVIGLHTERAILTATPTPVTGMDRSHTDTLADSGKTRQESVDKEFSGMPFNTGPRKADQNDKHKRARCLLLTEYSTIRTI